MGWESKYPTRDESLWSPCITKMSVSGLPLDNELFVHPPVTNKRSFYGQSQKAKFDARCMVHTNHSKYLELRSFRFETKTHELWYQSDVRPLRWGRPIASTDWKGAFRFTLILDHPPWEGFWEPFQLFTSAINFIARSSQHNCTDFIVLQRCFQNERMFLQIVSPQTVVCLFKFCCLSSAERPQDKLFIYLTTKCGRGTYFLALSFLIDFFEHVDNFLPVQGKLLRISNLLLRLKYFPKTLFCPTTIFSGLCSSDHPCMKILFLVGFLGLGVIYSEKFLRSVCHLQKLCKLFPQALIYLKGEMLIYRLMLP